MWTRNEGFYARFKYVETAHFMVHNNKPKVVRTQSGPKSDRRPILIEWNNVEEFARKHDNTGIYTSIFRYDGESIDSATSLGSLYFDLDSNEPEESQQETVRLVSHLMETIPERSIRIYFSGQKGFHIECEAVALGIGPTNDLPDIFRYITKDLEDSLGINTFDYSVYEPRRMWRLQNSIHQKTGLYKIPISFQELSEFSYDELQELAKNPRPEKIPTQEFNLDANRWYKEYTYEFEESKTNTGGAQGVIERFNKHGSGHITDFEREFDPVRLFEGCPVILELWEKAETKHNLTHEERLFLCSLLSYTDEAIDYLHAILSNVDDYNYEITQSHVEDWVNRRKRGIGGRPYTCQRARAAGIICGGCDGLEPKPKYQEIGGKLYPTDQFTDPSPIRFCYTRKGNP